MHMGSTLVLVADRGIGRYLLRDRPEAPLCELTELRLDLVEVGRDRDLDSHSRDRCGSQHRTGHGFSATDTKEKAFLLKVLRRTIDVFRAERADRLVLCAPPEDLSLLRGNLTTDLREHLSLSFGKDLTKETPALIDAHLRALCV